MGRVLTLRHGQGIGGKLLTESLNAIKEKMPCNKIYIHAQKHAEEFYKKYGFITTSSEFMEEGVAHIEMELTL